MGLRATEYPKYAEDTALLLPFCLPFVYRFFTDF